MPPKFQPKLGLMKFLASDAEVLSRVESPSRPLPPKQSSVPTYRTVYYRTIVEAKPPHPDFTARAERNRLDDERDVSWNDNRVVEEDEQ